MVSRPPYKVIISVLSEHRHTLVVLLVNFSSHVSTRATHFVMKKGFKTPRGGAARALNKFCYTLSFECRSTNGAPLSKP